MPGQLISLKTQEEKWVRQVRVMQRQRKPRCNALMKKHLNIYCNSKRLSLQSALKPTLKKITMTQPDSKKRDGGEN